MKGLTVSHQDLKDRNPDTLSVVSQLGLYKSSAIAQVLLMDVKHAE